MPNYRITITADTQSSAFPAPVNLEDLEEALETITGLSLTNVQCYGPTSNDDQP